MYYAKIKNQVVQVILLYKVFDLWFVYSPTSGHALPVRPENILGPVLI